MNEDSLKLYSELTAAAEFIASQTTLKPKVGLVLGSGLGPYASRVENPTVIPFSKIPHFPRTTVEGHEGRLVIGTIAKTAVAVLQGRAHYYEGHTFNAVTFAVRALHIFGVKTFLLTNAAGGINTSFHEADLMLITDHLNFMGVNPLRGPNIKELGVRFPDMTEIYDRQCNDVIRSTAKRLSLTLHEGVYVAVSGPSYETPAEIKMFRTLGADAVGMSTVPEAIAANHAGCRVAGISLVTNLAAGISKNKLSHDEVIMNGKRAADKTVKLLDAVIPLLPTGGRNAN